MIRLVIVSDIKLYREGLDEILDRKDSVRVVGTAYNVKKAIVKIQNSSPDVVLIDMTMIACSEIVGQIASSCPNTKIIALAVTEDEDIILACAKAGISGYVSREASIEQLVNTICGVIEGELYCPRRIAASLFHKLETIQRVSDTSVNVTPLQPEDSKISLLTQREKQIAKQLTNGDRKSTRLNSSHTDISRMPSSA